MSIEANLTFRIGLVGPSRVGKTSLVATMLRDTQRLLQGTPAKIEAFGTKSKRRLADHDNEIKGAVYADEFNPGAVSGTEEAFTFELLLDPGPDGAALHFGLQDFPGSWLDDAQRPANREADWEAYKRWVTQSSVLVVPIEATVLMEATASSHRKAVPAMLALTQVEDLVRHWAKGRAASPDEPALLLLCPVKCESYFSDNGGSGGHRASKLFDHVNTLYGSALKDARQEAEQIRVVYAPVDTMGCVDVVRTEWLRKPDAPGGYDCQATYRVRAPHKLNPKGGDSLMALLCEHVMKVLLREEERIARMRKDASRAADQSAEKDEGFFGNIWVRITGERGDRIDRATEARKEMDRQLKRVTALGRALEPLVAFKRDNRIVEL